ncbi:uncharacterized protein LOC128201282 [Galleria mellonella]|uniref:Uncharacterized protein LOC128201282 n=1 Tax=Galleria mellonella TaxID=7137 RepID=A0ABM3MQX7_GALME|nr:uncharacterized protein LOC128201282 [Galleria mellonella]
MFPCARCNLQSTDGTLCSVCKRRFDFPCAGITESGYRKLGERRHFWRCTECKTNTPSAPSSRAQSPSVPSIETLHEELKKISLQLSPLASLIADVKTIKSDVTNLQNDVKVIKSDVTSLQKSIEMAHESIKDYSTTINSLETRLRVVEDKTEYISKLEADITRINQLLNDKEQWSRANNVEIRGVPQKNNENLFDIAMKIGNVADYEINKCDINFITRVPSRQNNGPKSIVMALNNRYIKDNYVAAVRRMKHLNLNSLGFAGDGRFYVGDHLTVENKQLLSKTKSIAHDKKFQYVWVKHSKIMVRKSPTSPIIVIKSAGDLLKLT